MLFSKVLEILESGLEEVGHWGVCLKVVLMPDYHLISYYLLLAF